MTEIDRAKARLAALDEAGLLGVLVATLDGRALEVNDALLALVGYGREEILSGAVPWTSVTPIEWRARDELAIRDLRATGRTGLREKEYARKTGERVPVIVGTAMLDPAAGETVSFVLDVSRGRRAAEEAAHLREALATEAMFRSLLDAAPDAIVVTGSDGRIRLVNGQTEKLFGYDRAALVGSSLETLVPERHRTRHVAHRQGYAADAKVRPMGSGVELHARRKDGSEFPIEIALSPIATPEGPLVFATVRDVTERRRADEARATLAAIVDSSDDAIVGTDVDGAITSWNASAREMFGYAPEEVLGRSVSLLVPEAAGAEQADVLSRLARGEHVSAFDTVRRHKDGHGIEVSVRSSPVRDARGRLIGLSKIIRDVSERRRAEEEIVRAKKATEDANRELEAFSYSVAHDLRAPLRGMSGFAHVLLEAYGGSLDAEGKDWLQEIVQNARKMGELIDALLSLSRVARSALALERVDLSELAREVLGALRASDPGRAVEVVVADGLSADADVRLARSLLQNLLGNAWKFTAKTGAARIELGLAPCADQGGPALFVRDNGAGFDEAFASKLFAPFQRLHASSEFAGTGIGLATVQRIARRHGGRVWAEGAVDRGATFFFTLAPRAEAIE